VLKVSTPLETFHSCPLRPSFVILTPIFPLIGWWYGEPDGEPDGRRDEPYVEPARCELELTAAGFGCLDVVVPDGEVPYAGLVKSYQNLRT
jgi:hypothetical protein